MAKTATAHHTVTLELCNGFCMPDTAFWQSQFLGMMHSQPARTLFEWCSHSVNVLWGANCFNTTTCLLNSWAGLFKVVYPRLHGMSWQHFTVSMNPKFLAKFTLGRQRSYRCSYKMILPQKHAVHQSMTPFQTEGYSRLCHLAASFPFPAHAKKRKMLLPNCPIHWRTLWLCDATWANQPALPDAVQKSGRLFVRCVWGWNHLMDGNETK